MISIRKFVAYAGGAAGVCGALLLATTTSTGIAAAPSGAGWSVRPAAQLSSQETTEPALSPACAAAFQQLKSAVQTDRTEDAQERSIAMTDPDTAADVSEDATELAGFRALFAGIRTACAPAAPTIKPFVPTKPMISTQCAAAFAAVRSFWAQGRPTTETRWAQLFALLRVMRASCTRPDPDRF